MDNLYRRAGCVAISIAILAGSNNSGLARTDVSAVGGNGGADYRVECFPGYVPTGSNMFSGTASDSTDPICILRNEQISGWSGSASEAGAQRDKGGRHQKFACNSGFAVHLLLHASMKRKEMADHYGVKCPHLRADDWQVRAPERMVGQLQIIPANAEQDDTAETDEIRHTNDPEDFQGTWQTVASDVTFDLVLRVSGTTVTGEYTVKDKPEWRGTIKGTLKAINRDYGQSLRLNFQWESPEIGQSDKGYWDLTEDGRLEGWVTRLAPSGSGKVTRPWNGVRVSGTDSDSPRETYTGSVLEAVTVYRQEHGDGGEVCYLDEGDQVDLISRGEGLWVQLIGRSGDCNGQKGWAYNDGKLDL